MFISMHTKLIPTNKRIKNRINEHGNMWFITQIDCNDCLVVSMKDGYRMWVDTEQLNRK
jgi:hypothetical protein